jgi:hypothetical protein
VFAVVFDFLLVAAAIGVPYTVGWPGAWYAFLMVVYVEVVVLSAFAFVTWYTARLWRGEEEVESPLRVVDPNYRTINTGP